jgi:hypothetical protein
MAKIPKQNLIQEAMESHFIYEDHRPYLGMSEIGGKCQRKLWYSLHWAYPIHLEPREHRIFERGDIEEKRVIRDLNAHGMQVTLQQKEIMDKTGHLRGHIDGLVCYVPGAEKTRHLLEVKTMNHKRYMEYLKKGLQETNPGYYVQMNQYLGWMNLDRCLYVVTNKNDEDRNYRRYEFDKVNFDEYKGIAFDILIANRPPKRIGESTWFECKFCRARGICHFNEPISRNCRTCKNVNIEQNGEWSCSINNNERIPESVQRTGCEDYQISEAFDE